MTLVLQIAAGIILAVVVLNLWARFHSRRLERAQRPKFELQAGFSFLRALIIGLAVVAALAALVIRILR